MKFEAAKQQVITKKVAAKSTEQEEVAKWLYGSLDISF